MYTIKENNNSEIIVKNSRFITFLYRINKLEEFNSYLNNIKKLYPDATHYCYAYILDNLKKSSDDNEPSGTAGTPILQVLDKNKLNYILCIIVRFFGGIKLGSNGLIRAYSKSVSNCLKNNTLIELEKGYNINITFDYNNLKKVDYLLKDIPILKKDYGETINYNLNLNLTKLKELEQINGINIKVIDNINIEKK